MKRGDSNPNCDFQYSLSHLESRTFDGQSITKKIVKQWDTTFVNARKTNLQVSYYTTFNKLDKVNDQGFFNDRMYQVELNEVFLKVKNAKY